MAVPRFDNQLGCGQEVLLASPKKFPQGMKKICLFYFLIRIVRDMNYSYE